MIDPARVDDETLMAFLDGELDDSRAAEVAAAVAADPQLALRLERHKALGDTLRAAFAPVLEAPAPDRLRAAARRPAKVEDLAAFRDRQKPAKARPLWREPQALGLIAASLLGAWVIGQTFLAPPPAPFVEQHGQVLASGALARALDTELASAGSSGVVRVVLTFRDHEGAICRSFSETATSGVACREGGGWVVKAMFGDGAKAAGSGYRMASGGDPRLMQTVGDLMVGDAFDAAQERAARAGGWKALALKAP